MIGLALIECEECGDEVSEKAESCPNCGAPVRSEREKFWGDKVGVGGCLGIFIVVGLSIFALVSWGISESTKTDSREIKSVKLKGTGLSVSNYLEFMEENNLVLDDKEKMPESSSSYPEGMVSRFYESGEESPYDDLKMQLFGPSDDLYQVKLHSVYFSSKAEAIEKLMLIEEIARVYSQSKHGELEKNAVFDVGNFKKADWETIQSQLKDFDHTSKHGNDLIEVSIFKENESPRFSAQITIATQDLADFRKAQN